jgi:hypothetical protein
MKKSILTQCIHWSNRYNTIEKHPEFLNYKHFSYIIQDNKVISFGLNRAGPPPIGYLKYQKIHSEYIAWRKAKGLLNKNKTFDIINIRLNKKNDFRLSKPCICCNNFLKSVGCKNIYYSVEENNAFAKMSLI